MDKKTLQQIIIILPIVLIVGIFAYYKYLLSPLNEKKKALQADLEQIKKDYDESLHRAERLPKLQIEIEVLNQEITEIQKKLPAKKDLPSLIRMLSDKMEHYKISWSKLTPGSQSVKEYYIEHSYIIPFKSSYHDLAMFLADVGQMERIFATRFTKLTNVPPAAGSATTVSGELTFLIYTSK